MSKYFPFRRVDAERRFCRAFFFFHLHLSLLRLCIRRLLKPTTIVSAGCCCRHTGGRDHRFQFRSRAGAREPRRRGNDVGSFLTAVKLPASPAGNFLPAPPQLWPVAAKSSFVFLCPAASLWDLSSLRFVPSSSSLRFRVLDFLVSASCATPSSSSTLFILKILRCEKLVLCRAELCFRSSSSPRKFPKSTTTTKSKSVRYRRAEAGMRCCAAVVLLALVWFDLRFFSRVQPLLRITTTQRLVSLSPVEWVFKKEGETETPFTRPCWRRRHAFTLLICVLILVDGHANDRW